MPRSRGRKTEKALRELLGKLIETVDRQQPVAFAALVETEGSTPQKAGAAMLVFDDGSQIGTLGGGRLEAEIRLNAVTRLEDGECELMSFQLGDEGHPDSGRMRVLIEPVRSSEDASYYRKLYDALAHDVACTEATVIRDDGSAGRFLLDANGSTIASRSSFDPPVSVAQGLRDIMTRPRPYTADGVSYLPHAQRCRLIIVGAGHVGHKVSELATDVGFRVWVADDREDYCTAERFPNAEKLLVGSIETTARQFEVDPSTFCIIVTRGHEIDAATLSELVNEPARYIGMIGSKRKIRQIFDDLREAGVCDENLRRVHAPLGFNIGSQTVPEIAISIVAELIAHRNLDPGSFSKVTRESLMIEEA